MGVNSSASYDIHNSNYLSSSTLDTETTDRQEPFSVFAVAIVSLKIACTSVLSTASFIRYGVEKAWAEAMFGIRRGFF